nr:hypothetical protein [Bacillota bacterium]
MPRPSRTCCGRASTRWSTPLEPEHYSSNSLEYLAEHPVGTGPYMLESWQRDAQTVMVAFEDHWRGKPAIDRIIWRVIPNDGTRLAELQAGTVDIITNLPPDLADDIDAREGLRVEAVQGGRPHLHRHAHRHGALQRRSGAPGPQLRRRRPVDRRHDSGRLRPPDGRVRQPAVRASGPGTLSL